VNVLDPEAIIIGGGFGLGLSEGPDWDHLNGATRQKHLVERASRPAHPARRHWNRRRMGAAARAWQHFKATSLTTKP
jgi:hypothetical protein